MDLLNSWEIIISADGFVSVHPHNNIGKDFRSGQDFDFFGFLPGYGIGDPHLGKF